MKEKDEGVGCLHNLYIFTERKRSTMLFTEATAMKEKNTYT